MAPSFAVILMGERALSRGAALFERLEEGYRRSPVAKRSRTIRIGGHAVRMGFAGEALESMLFRALAHLEVPACEGVDAEIRVWVSEGSGSAMAAPAWEARDFSRKALVPGLSDGRFTTLWLRSSRGVAVIDHRRNAACVWAPSAASFPAWEYAAPLRYVFDFLARDWGGCLIHGAAVGCGGKGILIGGPGGIGKSTLALECVRQGFGYVGDDYCVVESGRCHSLYGTGKRSGKDQARLPWFGALCQERKIASNEKTILFVNETWPERMATCLEIKALVSPRFSSDEVPRMEATGAGDVLKRLAPSTLIQSEVEGGYVLRALKRLATSVPAYELYVPSDVASVPGFLGEFLGERQ